jgi:hypothetical protein
MSIAVLSQVYDEMRRLAIAGSVNAGGDFRLKKLIAPLEQAGVKAPVFAKVGEAVKAVVEGKEQDSAQALLELTTLVNAILYTQGETGSAGAFERIETNDLGVPSAQTSARMLKPLLEALSTTGSGRLELIRDAHERGAFRDIRLVKPALDAIDDPFPEIADFIAANVLPLYGKAILPDLCARFDMKGRAGHPRRLSLMHAIDPAGSREAVKQALEAGSKEVKVAAIECLGAEPDDLSYLIEQASAKAQEVRQAAYRALSGIDHDDAVAVLQKALTGKDLDLAADCLCKCPSAKLVRDIIALTGEMLAEFAAAGTKKKINPMVGRLNALVSCLKGRDDAESIAFLLSVFSRRAELAKVKSDLLSGAHFNTEVVRIMAYGPRKLQTALAEAHGSMEWNLELMHSFHAARHALPADRVFEMFSPYLTADVDEKKKKRDPAYEKRKELLDALGGRSETWEPGYASPPSLDPRWLDLAVEMKNLALVRSLIRPGHAAANAYLKEAFDEAFKKAKHFHDCHEVLAGMIAAAHADATDAYVATLEKFGNKADYFGDWYGRLVVDLPKSALPRLEAMIPHLNERVADSLLGYMQQLREKP